MPKHGFRYCMWCGGKLESNKQGQDQCPLCLESFDAKLYNSESIRAGQVGAILYELGKLNDGLLLFASHTRQIVLQLATLTRRSPEAMKEAPAATDEDGSTDDTPPEPPRSAHGSSAKRKWGSGT